VVDRFPIGFGAPPPPVGIAIGPLFSADFSDVVVTLRGSRMVHLRKAFRFFGRAFFLPFLLLMVFFAMVPWGRQFRDLVTLPDGPYTVSVGGYFRPCFLPPFLRPLRLAMVHLLS
jgi:hypothetical protein